VQVTKTEILTLFDIDFMRKKCYNIGCVVPSISVYSLNHRRFIDIMKKLIALALCLIMILSAFAGCATSEDGKEEKEEDPGAYIRMYITEPIYNFDPALAYGNEAALRIVSLLYDNLFVIGENGKPTKSLVKDYDIDKKTNSITLTLRSDTYWSDGSPISANDVFFAWERLLDSTKSFEAASLLYNVKNAKAAKEGDVSIEDVGIQLLNETQLMIELNEGASVDEFLINLSSYALAPLRSDIIRRAEKEIDWAKSPTSMVTSGPFRLRTISYDPDLAGLTLERNSYYQRDFMNDAPDVSVTPYRLIVDYTMSGEEILAAYEKGEIFFVGDLPLDVRSTKSLEAWSDMGEVADVLSTHTYVFNHDAVVRYYNASAFDKLSTFSTDLFGKDLVEGTDGDKIFAKAEVRKALSLAINRDEIAKAVVFAEAAKGLVPNGVFETTSKNNLFSDNRANSLSSTADVNAAKSLLSSAGVDAGKYMFAISVPAYDEVHMKIAEMVKASWEALGFHVAICAIENIDNTDKAVSTNAAILGVKDDIFYESYKAGLYEVAPLDYTAFSPVAFSVLAPLAKGYSGNASIEERGDTFFIATHISGYDSEAYNAKIAAAHESNDPDERAKLLHEAEDILLEEMPIIPILQNKSLTLESKELSKTDYTYYGAPVFTKTKLKNYEDYIPAEKE
jgi:oligopeptide transport system substrate-binding protein